MFIFDILPIHRILLYAVPSNPNGTPYRRTLQHDIGRSFPQFHITHGSIYPSRRLTVSYTRLRILHSLLLHYFFKTDLNSSPLCTQHKVQTICDLEHIVFNCPTLSPNRRILSSLFSSQGYITPDSQLSFHTYYTFPYQLHPHCWLPNLKKKNCK